MGLGELAEHLAVRRAAQHAIAAVLNKLPLAVIDRLLPVDPSQPFIVGRIHDEQGVELRNGTTHLPVVVGLAPIGKAFPRGPQECALCLIEKRIHTNQKLKSCPDFYFLLLPLLRLLNPFHCAIDRGDDLPPPLRCYRAA